jgi:hypothetical protein
MSFAENSSSNATDTDDSHCTENRNLFRNYIHLINVFIIEVNVLGNTISVKINKNNT